MTPAGGGEIDEPMSLGELCDPKKRSVDTRSPLLGVTGSWKSDGLDEEGESAIPEPPHPLITGKQRQVNHLESLVGGVQ